MDAQKQKEEIDFLRSKWKDNIEIFDNDTDYISGKLSVSPLLVPGFKVRCNDHHRDVAHLIIRVTALPPIELLFQFTSAYPSKDMPTYQISCLWLSYDQMRQLCRELNRLWQTFNKSPILDSWACYLQEETLPLLGMENLLDLTDEPHWDSPLKKKMKYASVNKGYGKHRVLVVKLDMPISEYIIKYSKNKKIKQFLSSSHTCSMCTQVTTGSRTIVFKTCRHEFCFECMRHMVSTVKPLINLFYICPLVSCEKTISKSKVWSFIDDVSSHKSYQMKEVTTTDGKIEFMRVQEGDDEAPKKLVECPGCSSFVGVYSMDDTLAICSSCANIFCYLCNRIYHGLTPCHIAPEDKVRVYLGYTTASETGKTEYINQYGLRRLNRLVNQLSGELEARRAPRAE